MWGQVAPPQLRPYLSSLPTCEGPRSESYINKGVNDWTCAYISEIFSLWLISAYTDYMLVIFAIKALATVTIKYHLFWCSTGSSQHFHSELMTVVSDQIWNWSFWTHLSNTLVSSSHLWLLIKTHLCFVSSTLDWINSMYRSICAWTRAHIIRADPPCRDRLCTQQRSKVSRQISQRHFDGSLST